MSSLTRRHFLTTTTGAGLAGILATGVPPARGQQREISYLCWNNFAPLSDKKLAELGPRFTKDTGIKIKIDHIAAPQQAAKYASEVQTQAGHDLVEMRMHVPWLYEPQLVDVSDIVTNLEKNYGKVIAPGYEAAHVKGVWRAVPQYHSIFVSAYREDLFKKAGLAAPKTWEDLYKVGLELKKMGHPVGIPISQNFDTISTGSAVMWCHGAIEVDKDGKTVKINSEQTAQVVEWYRKMYRDCMEPEVLSWSDASNNESLQQGKAGWIHNPVSAYIVARDQKLPSADGINHHLSLSGPSGRHDVTAPRSIGIWKFSKNIEPAKEWIRYLLGKKEVYDEYIMSGGAFLLPRLLENAGSRGPQDRSEAGHPQGRGHELSHLRLAGAGLRQGAAHHQLVHPAQHARQGGHGDLDEGVRRLGRERDEENHGGQLAMAVGSVGIATAARSTSLRTRISELLDRESWLGPIFVSPALVLILLLVAYPFCMALYFSVSNAFIGRPSSFIGLRNFVNLWDSDAFRQTFQNAFVFCGLAVGAKIVLGISLALLLNQQLWFKRLIRGAVLLPWVIPTALSTLGWSWMFNSLYSVVNWTLLASGIIDPPGPNWLGQKYYAMAAVIIVNIWRGLPFFAITLLAGLVAIPKELYEAAEADGAGPIARFWYVTLPLLKGVLAIVVLFSTIFTFSEFNIIYVLTHGGPINSTHLFATLARQVGLETGRIGEGAAISLYLFPALMIVVWAQLRYVRKQAY